MNFKKLVFIPMVAVLLAGCTIGGGGGKKKKSSTEPSPTDTTTPTDSSPTSKTDVPIVTGSVINDNYYDLSKYQLNGLRGAKLQFELHRLMLDTHQNVVLYSQWKNYESSTSDRTYSIDTKNKSISKNEFFYTGKEVAYSTTGTREHVWPCAKSAGLWVHSNYSDIKYYVDGSGYWGGGSDLYHVRPCTSAVNTARGDSKYTEFSAEEKASGSLYAIGDGGPYSLLCDAERFSTKCEPADEFKGDIARLCMYVYVHYAKLGDYNDETCGNLALTDVFYGETKNAAYEMIARWNELDPVSETEKLRNETVMAIQGNRNPFVDYPHLVRLALGI